MWPFRVKHVWGEKHSISTCDNWKVTIWKGSSVKLSSWGQSNKLCKNQFPCVPTWIFYFHKNTYLLPLCLLTLFIHQTHVPHHKAKCTNLHITSLHMVKWSRSPCVWSQGTTIHKCWIVPYFGNVLMNSSPSNSAHSITWIQHLAWKATQNNLVPQFLFQQLIHHNTKQFGSQIPLPRTHNTKAIGSQIPPRTHSSHLRAIYLKYHMIFSLLQNL